MTPELRMALAECARLVRERAPLVHCITAAASMNFVADALLAAGARPMMTETPTEAPLVVTRADALLVNLGTLSADGAAGIPPTVGAARERGLPWVLDPAAVGPVTPVRTGLAHRLRDARPAVIRGNASEIAVLAGARAGGRGPDSLLAPDAVVAEGRALARATGAVVAVSGPVDVIIGAAQHEARVTAGHPTLTRVTGTGCALGALTAACAAVAEPFVAALTASWWMGMAGERAAESRAGPGSFRVALLDALDAWTGDVHAHGH